LFQLLFLIYIFYLPLLRRTILERGSINLIPVVAIFVSKSDLRKTFDKISRTSPARVRKKPIEYFPVVVFRSSSGTALNGYWRELRETIAVLKHG
jgi:DNA integrity scanning protein DisA with diadenylate cyclase activity